MSEFAANHTMLVLLGLAFIGAGIWAVYALIRSIWLDEYGSPKD